MPPPSIPPRQDLLDRIDRCLGQFMARRVAEIEDAYEYVPEKSRARMGAGSYGETFRMKSKTNIHEPARIVKFINKARIAMNELQVQHLCVELAVLKLVRHPNLNHSTDLLHSDSTIFMVLELCEGQAPTIETRLYHFLSRFNPSKMVEVPSLLESLRKDCEGITDADKIRELEEDVIRRERTAVSFQHDRKEIPTSSDLFNCIVANTRLHPLKAAIIIKGVMQGLAHLHGENIVHRDMKTENIVLGETRKASPILDGEGKVTGVKITEKIDVKVIDFGLVKYMNLAHFPTTPSPGCFGGSDDPFARATSDVFDNTPSSAGSHLIHQTPGIVDVTPCGTEIYCALEVLEGIVGSGYGRRKWQTTKEQLPKFDVYGAGTALYCMINGRPPFRLAQNRGRGVSREERLREIHNQVQIGPAYWTSTCPPAMKDFILSLMRNNVRDRPSARESLRNPILSTVGDIFSYEVHLDGSIHNATAAPVIPAYSSTSARSAPIPSAVPKGKEPANEDEEEPLTPHVSESTATDEDLAVSDIELEKEEIDDIMAAIRGKEDDGDVGGKPAI